MKCILSAIAVLVMIAWAAAQNQATSPVENKSVPQPCFEVSAKPDVSIQPGQLHTVKRIYVESFGDDPISKEMQSMIVSSLVSAKRFVVTEDHRRADAVFKGTALEKTTQEIHAYGEGTAVGSAAGGHQGSVSGNINNGNGSISGSSSGGFVAHSLGINDSSLNTETIDNARIAVRLVNSDGDVIWTTTQESKGAKYKSASADVADMCIKQLLRDIARLEGNASQSTAVTAIESHDGRRTK